jgi:uncharacterized phage protein gp47/JayE
MSNRCCTPRVPAAPFQPSNPPGRDALAFRIGTFATFREAMLDAVSGEPTLAALRTRASDDFAIAPIEAWAALADVLTFYQERYANEGYLRTAQLRESIVRLVRLVDYRPAPGAAATTLAAFTLEAGSRLTIPPGVRMQSVPQGDAAPVKFETIAALDADAALDRLRVFDAPRALDPGGDDAFTYVDPTDDAGGGRALAAGQRLIAFDAAGYDVVTVAHVAVDDDRIRVAWESPGATTRAAVLARRTVHVLGAEARVFGHDAAQQYLVFGTKVIGTTTVSWPEPAQTDYSWDGAVGDTAPGSDRVLLAGPAPRFVAGTRVLVVTKTGATAPTFTGGTLHVNAGTVTLNEQVHAVRGPLAATTTKLTISFDGAVPLVADDVVSARVYELVGPPVRFWDRTFEDRVSSRVLHVPGVRRGPHTIELGRVFSGRKTTPGNLLDMTAFPAGRSVIVGDDASAFAATADHVELIGRTLSVAPAPGDARTLAALGLADGAGRITALVSAPGNTTPAFASARPEIAVTFGARPPLTVAVDTTGFPALPNGPNSIEIVNALASALANAASSAGIAAPLVVMQDGRFYVIALDAQDQVALGPSSSDPVTVSAFGLDPMQATFIDGLRSAPIEPLVFDIPAAGLRYSYGADPLQSTPPFLLAAGSAVDDLAISLSAALSDPNESAPLIGAFGDRLVVLPGPRSIPVPAYLRVTLSNGDPYDLDASRAALLANVVAASHGETVHDEVAGDGDASVPFQHFTLRKKPVTHVVDARSGELRPALTFSLNGIAWNETATLYGAAATDRVYATAIGDDATMTVQTGDGESGARPPSGRSNAVATYRVGLGRAGNVPANAVRTLLDRPNGLRSATNPVPAEGGADPQPRDEARLRAPTTVRTFGRAISLADFEDASLGGGLLAKASATWVWDGDTRAIHLTVSGRAGARLSPVALASLRTTLLAHRDPNHRLIVADYAPLPVVVRARLVVDAAYLRVDVLARARAALLDALAFDTLAFGESIHVSAIYATLQGVEGVSGVDVGDLDFKTKDAAFLAAHGRDPLARPQPHLFVLPARPAPGGLLRVLPAELATVESPDVDVTLDATGGRDA